MSASRHAALTTFHEGEPKSWERRTVAFPAFLDVALAALCIGKRPDDIVFSDGAQYLRQPRTSKSWLLTGLRVAGIERLTPHDLRHTAASLAVSAGANVKVLQRMLGHKCAAMTLDTYADLFDDGRDDVATKLDTQATSSADVGKLWAELGIRAS
ncbi:tyrosine-type recombinase/integrase [Microbacterium binotii]